MQPRKTDRILPHGRKRSLLLWLIPLLALSFIVWSVWLIISGNRLQREVRTNVTYLIELKKLRTEIESSGLQIVHADTTGWSTQQQKTAMENIQQADSILNDFRTGFSDTTYVGEAVGEMVFYTDSLILKFNNYVGDLNQAPMYKISEYFQGLFPLTLSKIDAATTAIRADNGRISYALRAKWNQINTLAIIGCLLAVWSSFLFIMNRRRLRETISAKNEAEQATRVKSTFISNVSHEIRTPLNAIIGLTDLLIKENTDKQQQHSLKTIKHASDHLLALVNDVLDFSKIEAGKITFYDRAFKIRPLLKHLMAGFEYQANEKGVKLQLDIDDTVPKYLVGDSNRLKQILLNLVGNALKFTHEGKVQLKVDATPKRTHTVRVNFRVEDTGIGIAPAVQKKIFNTFEQGGEEITRNYGGTGLGLSIVKNLVELQGGKITLDSTPGQGSVFSFWLDMEEGSPNSATADADGADEAAQLKGLRILAAEDNVINQQIIRRLMEHWQVELTIVKNGNEVLEKLEAGHTYDLLLLDLQMPEKDGLETCRAIRRDKSGKWNPQLPVIALSANVLIETRDKVFAAGMNDYVSKPFRQEELSEKILKHLEQ